jgi:hypothetical protein
MAVVLGALAGWLAHAARVAGGADPSGGRRVWSVSWPELVAAVAAVPACLTTTVLFGDASTSPVIATVGGWSAGLVAGLGQLAAQLQIVPADTVSRVAGEGRVLSGTELALATRARGAWRRIRAGAAERSHVDRLAERLTIQVLLLAARSHALGVELRAVDAALVRRRTTSAKRPADSDSRPHRPTAGRRGRSTQSRQPWVPARAEPPRGLAVRTRRSISSPFGFTARISSVPSRTLITRKWYVLTFFTVKGRAFTE